MVKGDRVLSNIIASNALATAPDVAFSYHAKHMRQQSAPSGRQPLQQRADGVLTEAVLLRSRELDPRLVSAHY